MKVSHTLLDDRFTLNVLRCLRETLRLHGNTLLRRYVENPYVPQDVKDRLERHLGAISDVMRKAEAEHERIRVYLKEMAELLQDSSISHEPEWEVRGNEHALG